MLVTGDTRRYPSRYLNSQGEPRDRPLAAETPASRARRPCTSRRRGRTADPAPRLARRDAWCRDDLRREPLARLGGHRDGAEPERLLADRQLDLRPLQAAGATAR